MLHQLMAIAIPYADYDFPISEFRAGLEFFCTSVEIVFSLGGSIWIVLLYTAHIATLN